MRKLIAILAVLALAGAASAQKKKKPAAKPAATVDTAKANAEAKAKGTQDAAKAKADAAQADLAAKANAATAVDESKFTISVWGGYSITSKSDYVKNAETIFGTVSGVTASNDTKVGGISGGADFFYGSNFQIGASVGYLKGHDLTRTLTSSPDTYILKSTMDYAPILLSARYFIIPGLYVGAGVGVSSVLNGVESLKKNGVAETIDLPPKGTAGSVNWDFAYKGTAVTLQGRLGYDYAINSSLSVGLMTAFTYLTAELDPVGTAPNNQSVTGKGTHNSFIITPALAVTFKF